MTLPIGRHLVCCIKKNICPASLHCALQKIQVPNSNSVKLVFSEARSQAKNRKIVLKSKVLIASRGWFCNIPHKFLTFPAGLISGGLYFWRFGRTNLLRYNGVLCEGRNGLNQHVMSHNFKEKFILLRWISNVISFIRVLLRALRLFITFSPFLLLYPFTILSSRLKIWWWHLMLWAVEFSGPAFVKLGQWASTRRDLFSKEFCDRFSKLHHHAKAHSWYYTAKSFEKAYGPMWREFLLFDNDAEPIGSGCVAQVYKAYVRGDKLGNVELEKIQEEIHDLELASDILADQKTFSEGVLIKHLEPFKKWSKRNLSPGDAIKLDVVSEPGKKELNFDHNSLIPVAVKVLHPGVRETFSRDLTLMSAVASFVQLLVPSLRWLSLTECVAEFSTSMKKQMNMRHEARCLDRLLRSFTDDKHVRIPVPLWPLITRDVLVETFEEGEPISNFLHEGDKHMNSLRRKLAELGVNALLEMVFVNNFVHGDLHPGNILVQNATDFKESAEDQLVVVNVGDTVITGVTKPECPVNLVFLDCGITASLSESDRIKFREVFTAVVKGEGEAVADLFLRKTAHVECKDPEAFRKDMAAVVMQARQETLSLSQIHVAELLSEVFRVLRTHRVKLESNFATVILAIAVLEGLGRSLDPELDILEKARPVLIHQTVFS